MIDADDESLAGLTGGILDTDSELFRQENDSNLRQRYFIAALTERVTTNHYFKTLTDTKELYYYDSKSGVYRSNGESIIEALVETMKPNVSTHEVNEVINHVKRRKQANRSEFDSQIEWLTLKNCVVNLKTLEVQPHSPNFMATLQISISYRDENNLICNFFEWIDDPDVACPCPAILKFMHEVMAHEDVETVLDFIAYCLWRSFPFHVYLLFNGSGRNGKVLCSKL